MDSVHSLEVYRQSYETATRMNPGHSRDAVLAELMTNMERQYHIPMQAHPEWNAKHRAVIKLYRKIANSRTTL